MNYNSETYLDRMIANATKFTELLLFKGLLFRAEYEFSEEKTQLEPF